MGGLEIVCGLTCYGYKIISAIGIKIAKITPSRGFNIELASALTVIIGTRLELPLSTTHCQVGEKSEGVWRFPACVVRVSGSCLLCNGGREGLQHASWST